MKKFISLLICAVMIVLNIPSVFAVYGDEILLWDMIYCDENDERIFAPCNGEVYSKAQIYNGSAEKDVNIINCVYSSGSLKNVKVDKVKCESGYSEIESSLVTASEGDKVKTLLIDSTLAPIEKRSSFINEINSMRIDSFSLSSDDVTYEGIINDKTGVILVDVPIYTSGEGESPLLKPDMTKATENISVLGGVLSEIDTHKNFDSGVRYAVTDSEGDSRIYTAYSKYSVRQYSSDFSNNTISGNISDKNGAASLSVSGSESGNAISVSDGMLKIEKTVSSDNELTFTADKGCASVYVTDYRMDFDLQIDEFSISGAGMSIYMGELHHIVPFKTDDGYTLKYKCSAMGGFKEISGIGEFELGEKYNITYIFSQDDLKGELYINGKYKATLENTYGWEPSTKLTPIFSASAYKSAQITALIDNVQVTYREDVKENTANLHIIGDSITHTYAPNEKEQEGWGAYMEDSFNKNITVTNHAVVGQSSGMTLFGGEPKRHDMAPIWPLLKHQLKEGDYVMVSFGWNEGNSINPYYCTSADDFINHLEILYQDIKGAGASLLLVTPTLGIDTSNISFRDDNHKWADAMKAFAGEHSDVVCLDLHAKQHTELESIGAATIYKDYHVDDGVHYKKTGALYNANTIKALLKDSESTLKNYLEESSATPKTYSRAFSVSDASGRVHYGYVNDETKTITIEQISDMYTGRKPISRFYNERNAEDFPEIKNAPYVMNIQGKEASGEVTVSDDIPGEITFDGDKYTVYLKKHVAASTFNFDAGDNLFTPENARSTIAESEGKALVVNQYQNVPGTFGGSRYGAGFMKAECKVSSKNIRDIQCFTGETVYNVSYAPNSGRNGKNDTALRIIKRGNSSSYDPRVYLCDTGDNWGKDVMDISFDVKYTDFNGTGNAFLMQLLSSNNALCQLAFRKVDDDTLGVYYTAGGSHNKVGEFDKDTWTNIRLILDRSSQKPYTVCINDMVVLETADKYGENVELPNNFVHNIVNFGSYSSAESTYYLDNVHMTCSQAK